ncbi:unnamed protein product [Caenorhabditis auriculariae]|uniref:TGF-beta family profile domain-containing protein n=1 Tax=Caenorhabditis auriculariae TaxID=2777116 RepID=A0A8S1H148_9PELO|nr:unnamed protein product [Caenorhabditis auriculariae]
MRGYIVLALMVLPLMAADSKEESRLAEVKANILRELGMQRPPNVSEMNIPLEQLRAQFRPIFEKEYADNKPQETETFYLTAKKSFHTTRGTFRFEVTDAILARQIEKMELTFNFNKGQESVKNVINVYQRFDNGTGTLVGSRQLLKSGHVKLTLEKQEIEKVLLDSNLLTLQVEVIVDDQEYDLYEEDNEDEIMMMAVTCVSKSRTRRRANPVCLREDPTDGCCRYDMIVDFDKIGWHWIVAPPQYNAFVCRGDCALNGHHMHNFGHTKIVKAVFRKDADMASFIEKTASCCHAGEYAPLSLIYINHDGAVVASSVSAMIAEHCSCS